MKTIKICTVIFVTLFLLPYVLKAQWIRINNSPANVQRIYFYNAQTGYALKNNEIYKTTDGGNSWNNIPNNFNSYISLSDIYFVNQDTGFVLLSDNMTFAYPVSAYITQDGGITWNSLLGPFDGGTLDFYFQNSTNWYFYMSSNWMIGVDTIYQTADAGTTWTKTGNTTQVQYNQLINKLIVYKDSVTPNQDNLFYKSTDGGASWNLLLIDNTTSAGFMDYQFLNSNDGYVLLYQYNQNDTINSKIYKTTDGGLTWDNYTLPTVCSNPQSIYFTSNNTGYIISNNTVQHRSEIFKTTDGGQTWNIDFFANSNEYFYTGIVAYYQNLYVLGNDIFTNSITTSVKEMNFIEKISSVFPNPFSIETTLQMDENLNEATLTVYNSFGQTVKQMRNITGQTFTLSRDNLANGAYFIRLTEENKLITTVKLVISD